MAPPITELSLIPLHSFESPKGPSCYSNLCLRERNIQSERTANNDRRHEDDEPEKRPKSSLIRDSRIKTIVSASERSEQIQILIEDEDKMMMKASNHWSLLSKTLSFLNEFHSNSLHSIKFPYLMIILMICVIGGALGRPSYEIRNQQYSQQLLHTRNHRPHSLHKRHHFLLPFTSSTQLEITNHRDKDPPPPINDDYEENDQEKLTKVKNLPIDQNDQSDEEQFIPEPPPITGNDLLVDEWRSSSDSDSESSGEKRMDRDERDLEVDSVKTNKDGSIDLTATHRLTKTNEVDGIIEKSMNSFQSSQSDQKTNGGESEKSSNSLDPSSSIQDGHYSYSVGNSSEKKKLSLEAFRMLKAEPNQEEQLEIVVEKAEKPKNSHSHQLLQNLPSEQRIKQVHRSRKKKPGQKLGGRNEALMSAMDAGIHKNQTCVTEKFKQRVKMQGCLTKVIVNRFCHGTCTSFFIPRMRHRLKASFQSCAACVPKEYDYMDVTLECPGMDPPLVTKTIVIVKKCACMSMMVNPELEF